MSTNQLKETQKKKKAGHDKSRHERNKAAAAAHLQAVTADLEQTTAELERLRGNNVTTMAQMAEMKARESSIPPGADVHIVLTPEEKAALADYVDRKSKEEPKANAATIAGDRKTIPLLYHEQTETGYMRAILDKIRNTVKSYLATTRPGVVFVHPTTFQLLITDDSALEVPSQFIHVDVAYGSIQVGFNASGRDVPRTQATPRNMMPPCLCATCVMRRKSSPEPKYLEGDAQKLADILDVSRDHAPAIATSFNTEECNSAMHTSGAILQVRGGFLQENPLPADTAQVLEGGVPHYGPGHKGFGQRAIIFTVFNIQQNTESYDFDTQYTRPTLLYFLARIVAKQSNEATSDASKKAYKELSISLLASARRTCLDFTHKRKQTPWSMYEKQYERIFFNDYVERAGGDSTVTRRVPLTPEGFFMTHLFKKS